MRCSAHHFLLARARPWCFCHRVAWSNAGVFLGSLGGSLLLRLSVLCDDQTPTAGWTEPRRATEGHLTSNLTLLQPPRSHLLSHQFPLSILLPERGPRRVTCRQPPTSGTDCQVLCHHLVVLRCSSATIMAAERRRSSGVMNSTAPEHEGSPGLRDPLMNTADPNHQRTPSLGQIHQQLENEQEAQVNRLLHLIKQQQDQLDALQTDTTASDHINDASSAIANGFTGAQSDVAHLNGPGQGMSSSAAAAHQSPLSPAQRPYTLSRHSSRGAQVSGSFASDTSSPSMRAVSTTRSHDEWSTGGLREEGAFYQAETHMLQRENQMLKMRIRELEKQIADLDKPSGEVEDPIRSQTTPSAS